MASGERAIAEPHPRTVFISYVREDEKRARELQRDLELRGLKVWRDRDQLWPGDDWRIEIRKAIRSHSVAFVACFSAASERREKSYQNEEILLAVDEYRQRAPGTPWLYPVRFDDVTLPQFDLGAGRTLESLQITDLFGPYNVRNRRRLIERLTGQSSPPKRPGEPSRITARATSLKTRTKVKPLAPGRQRGANRSGTRQPHLRAGSTVAVLVAGMALFALGLGSWIPVASQDNNLVDPSALALWAGPTDPTAYQDAVGTAIELTVAAAGSDLARETRATELLSLVTYFSYANTEKKLDWRVHLPSSAVAYRLVGSATSEALTYQPWYPIADAADPVISVTPSRIQGGTNRTLSVVAAQILLTTDVVARYRVSGTWTERRAVEWKPSLERGTNDYSWPEVGSLQELIAIHTAYSAVSLDDTPLSVRLGPCPRCNPSDYVIENATTFTSPGSTRLFAWESAWWPWSEFDRGGPYLGVVSVVAIGFAAVGLIVDRRRRVRPSR